MGNLTVGEFYKELEKSGTTIKDLLIENLDYVECELDDGSYLGYNVLLSVGGMEFCLKRGFCERAVVEGCLMVGESKRGFRFLLDWHLTIELDNYVIENLGYGGLVDVF